jgi:3-oxoacyl-[acyl-carrier protein] reductase
MKDENRVAVVTGGSRGIGKAIAIKLAKENCDVLITYQQDKVSADETVDTLKSLGKKAVSLQVEMSDPTAGVTICSHALKEFGKIDILINNAGIGSPKRFIVDSEETDWYRTINTNLNGIFRTIKAIVPHMRSRKTGNIVNISSNVTRRLAPNFGPYAVSKAGLEALTQVLAKEEAGNGIRVNAIAPGFVDTDLLQTAFHEVGIEKAEALLHSIPLKRLGLPSEIADMVAVLASNVSSYVTGQIIYVNGGGPEG